MTNQRVKLARCRDGQNHIDPKECPAYNDRGFGPVIADTSIDEPHEDTLYDDPVDIPAEAPLPPRTITVEPPEGDDWIERYGETVSHGCQRTDVHTLAECRDWPCPNTSQDECLMVRERYAARTHSDVIPPCVHHDDVGGREGPERGLE